MARTGARTRLRAAPKRGRAADDLRDRILQAFSERAKRSGIRSVVMGELASELRMSPTTLYAHFRSKEELVTAMVLRWSAELGAQEAVMSDASKTPLERFLGWTDAWSHRLVEYSPAFWSDLKHDYPEAWGNLQKDLARRKARGAALLQPRLREDLDARVALAVLDLIFTHVSDARLWDELGITRREAVRTAVAIWAGGALRSEARAPARRRKA